MGILGWDMDFVSQRRLSVLIFVARENYGRGLEMMVSYVMSKDGCNEMRVGLVHSLNDVSGKFEVNRNILAYY